MISFCSSDLMYFHPDSISILSKASYSFKNSPYPDFIQILKIK